MSKPTEEDPFTAALALKRATTTRLASSWLASSLSSFPDTPDSDDDLNTTGPLFTPAPPTLGLGAPVPKEFLGNDLSAKVEQERLRRRLLGPLMKKKKDGEEVVRKKEVVVEEEEEEGRSGLGRGKKGGKRKVVEVDVEMEDAGEEKTEVVKVVKKLVDSDGEERKGSKQKFANSFDAYKSQKKKKKRKRVEEEEEAAPTATPDAAPSTASAEKTAEGEAPLEATTNNPDPQTPNPQTPTSTLTSAAQERRRRKRERQKNKTKSQVSQTT